MKLSFSFAKTAAPKRAVVPAQVVEKSESKREIVEVSASAGIVTESHKSDQLAEGEAQLIIPCKSHYIRPMKSESSGERIHDAELQTLQDTPGLVSGSGDPTKVSNQKPKRPRTSILMQIREARARGEIRDAPEEAAHRYDADEFAWGLLRGMGYDESKDDGPDVTKDVVGNRSKLGLGVKLDSIKLPTNQLKKM